jgi:hypothetical protein
MMRFEKRFGEKNQRSDRIFRFFERIFDEDLICRMGKILS